MPIPRLTHPATHGSNLQSVPDSILYSTVHYLTLSPQAPITNTNTYNGPLTPRATSDCPSTVSGGAIAGIVIGSVAGTLLLLWLWRVCQLPGATSGGGEPDVGYRPPITRSRGRRSRRRSGTPYVEYVEKSRSGSRRRRDDLRRPAQVYLAD